MNENIDLTKILKYCPNGYKLYTPLYGEVEFEGIIYGKYPIVVTDEFHNIYFTEKGLYYDEPNAECLLFPSKEQRDWSKFTAPWLEKQGKPNPYSGVSFKYNGHTWGMCARDNGMEILVDGEIKERIFLDNKPQGKSALEAIKEEKVDNANKVKPKFKVGDWIVWQDKCYKVNYNGCGYELIDQNGLSTSLEYGNIDENARLWTMQDAKDGDVLFTSSTASHETFIFKSIDEKGNAECYFAYDSEDGFREGEYHFIGRTTNCKPATKEQRDLLFQKMKEAGYKWIVETKTLEKLVQPKFKVGDMIRHKETNKDDVYEINKVYDDSYGIAGFTWMIYMKYQDQYELVPNKFDPKTLKPFDKVLVRDDYKERWLCGFFPHIEDGIRAYKYATIDSAFKYCIPYNDDTKHLLCTKEEAPEYYRYWED